MAETSQYPMSGSRFRKFKHNVPTNPRSYYGRGQGPNSKKYKEMDGMIGEGGPPQPAEQAQPSGPVTTPATGNVLNQRQSLFRRMQTMRPDEVDMYRKEAASLGVQEDGWQRAFGTINKRNEEAKTVERWRADKEARTPPNPAKAAATPPAGDSMIPGTSSIVQGPPAPNNPTGKNISFNSGPSFEELTKGPKGGVVSIGEGTRTSANPEPGKQASAPVSGSTPAVNSTGNGRGAKAQQRREASAAPPAVVPAQSTAARQEAMGNFMESVKTTAASVMDRFRSRPAPAPDGSKVMPTNLRQQKDKKGNVTSYDLAPLVKNGAAPDVRINRATGLPFGYSPGGALPAGADAAMKQRGADSKARMDAGTAQGRSIFATAPKAIPVQTPATAAPRPAANQRQGYASGKDPMDRYSPAVYDRTKEAFATGNRRLAAETTVREGGADAMSTGQRQEFGKMYGDTKVFEQAGMTTKPTKPVTPAPQPMATPAMQPPANKSRFARVRR